MLKNLTKQETEYTCGPASLRSILGEDVPEKSLAEEAHATPTSGTEPEDLARVAREHGVDAQLQKGMTRDDLRLALIQGGPVIVNHHAWGDGHYSVVHKADDQYVYLMDPYVGRERRIPWDEFEKEWHDSDHDTVRAGIKTAMSPAEKTHYREGDLGPGVPKKKITPLPTIKEPKRWEFSAHPHLAEKAGPHIDIRLGDPSSGIAHSFVLPKKTELPKPGEMARVIPTFDHTIPYMNYVGDISTPYGKGTVKKGRRTSAEVYHADPSDAPGTKARFNLYEGPNPEEFSIRKDEKGRWFLHNKTQTRTGRPDIPDFKPSYKEIDPDEVDVTDATQAMMPKLDGAHGILELTAGRAPRLFSYREAKVSTTGLIEHTHKLPELLKTKVPKELDGTLMRCEILGVDKQGKAIPAETIGGLLNTKVWDSRKKQAEMGVELQVFPFEVIQHKGKSMADVPFSQKHEILKKVEKTFKPAWVPELATTPTEKLELLNKIRAKEHPLTHEGVVLVNPNTADVPIKAKFAPDFDVFVKAIHPAVSGKTGKEHDRAGAISYSWTPDGPIVGQMGGFKHDEARDMLKNPEKYLGRVAKAKAMRVFKDEKGELGALFQPRFKEWHLDKGDIEKAAFAGFLDELTKISAEAPPKPKPKDSRSKADRLLERAMMGATVGGAGAYYVGLPATALTQSLLASSMDSNSSKAPYNYEELAKAVGFKPGEEPVFAKAERPGEGFFAEGRKIPEHAFADIQRELKLDPQKMDQIRKSGLISATEHSPEIAAHELGHAHMPSGFSRVLSKLYHSRAIPVVGTLAGAAAAALPDEYDSALTYASPAIGAAGYAPTLMEEGRASLKGYRALKQLGKMSPEALTAARRTLMKAFGTYGAMAGLAAAPAAAILTVRHLAQE